MNARQYKPHRLPASILSLVIVLCAILASALGRPAPATAQALPGFAIVKDFGDTLYPGERCPRAAHCRSKARL